MLLRYLCPKRLYVSRVLILTITYSILLFHFLYINVIKQYPQVKAPRIVIKSNRTFKFIYNPAYKCNQRNPYLLMIIKSQVGNFENRDALRRTWAQQDKFGLIRRVFSLGIPNLSGRFKKMIDAKLRDENRTFGDLIQQNFHDGYFNNTLKTMMGFQWAYEYCSNVHIYFLFFMSINFYIIDFYRPQGQVLPFC